MALLSLHISVAINCPPSKVYDFASNPNNLPKWASGLSGSIKTVNVDWIAESPMGHIKIRFADRNKFGVLDNDITLPSTLPAISNKGNVFKTGLSSYSIYIE
jgi:uncharacterized membrane protein